MVYLAQYDNNSKVVGFIDELERFFGLEYEAELKEIGEITYKTAVEIEVLALEKIKLDKLSQIENDFQTAESVVIKVTHTTHGEIKYTGGAESADKIDKYLRLRNMAGLVDGHMIWNESGVETAHTDAEAKAVILTIGNTSSANDFTKKDRKIAVASATTVTAVEAI